MRTRHKSKTRILDQIIVVQVIVLFVLIAILKLTSKKSDKAAGNLDSYVTPTPQIQTEISPSPILTVEPTVTPEINEDMNGEDNTLLPGEDESDPEGTAGDNGMIPEGGDETGENGETSDTTDSVDLQSLDSNDDVSSNTNGSVPAFATGMSQEFISSLSSPQEGTILQTPGSSDIVYYMQTDPRWASKYYGGTDTIEKYGCGPTSLSIVISSLTDIKIDPVQMCEWAYEKDYWFPEGGSKHNLIPDAAQAFGLKVTGVENTPDAAEKLKTALGEGKLVIVLMGKGNFTKGGHFMVLRGITEDDMVYIADPNNQEFTDKTWKLSQIINEAKSWAGANGPFWIISK